MAVHGSVTVSYGELAEAIALTRGARRQIEDVPEQAHARLNLTAGADGGGGGEDGRSSGGLGAGSAA